MHARPPQLKARDVLEEEETYVATSRFPFACWKVIRGGRSARAPNMGLKRKGAASSVEPGAEPTACMWEKPQL